MDEVYPEAFSALVAPGSIVYPQSKLLILKLLQQNVEVLNPLPTYLQERGDHPTALYLAGDPHWNDKGMALAAEAIGVAF